MSINNLSLLKIVDFGQMLTCYMLSNSFLSHRGGIGEIEYDVETEEWIELSSTFLNKKAYLPLLKLLVEIKRQI